MEGNVLMWAVSTLLPVVLGMFATWVAMSVKIAEMRKDILHLEAQHIETAAAIRDKADKEIVNEMRKDIADIKRILMLHFSDAAKKNSTDT